MIRSDVRMVHKPIFHFGQSSTVETDKIEARRVSEEKTPCWPKCERCGRDTMRNPTEMPAEEVKDDGSIVETSVTLRLCSYCDYEAGKD